MKFTPKEDIRFGYATLEGGNAYDSAKQRVPDERVESWYRHGLAEIEGWQPAPKKNAGGMQLDVADVGNAQSAPKAGGK